MLDVIVQYVCPFCGQARKTLAECKTHMLSCPANPACEGCMTCARRDVYRKVSTENEIACNRHYSVEPRSSCLDWLHD